MIRQPEKRITLPTLLKSPPFFHTHNTKMPPIFIAVLIALQIFIYLAARAILWQFRIQASAKRKLTYALAYLFCNGFTFAALGLRQSLLFRLNAAMLVALLYIVFTSIAVFIIWRIAKPIRQPEKLAHELRLIAPALLIALFALSVYNAYTPVVRRVSIQINKPLAQPIRIGMASDTHLGTLVGARQLDKLAHIMQQEKVSIILLPGDIMDDDIAAYTAENMKPHLAKLRAPLGVYATLGNHDYFINPQAITRAIEDAGITVLHDQAVLINHQFWLIGRPDNLDTHRLPTASLVQKTNPAQPIILLDHRPDHVAEHAKLPIDLQLSGHVHNGQIFPANFIAQAIYQPLAYGYQAIGNGHFVVTSGYGFWGIPFRLGSQSEVWIIDVKGK